MVASSSLVPKSNTTPPTSTAVSSENFISGNSPIKASSAFDSNKDVRGLTAERKMNAKQLNEAHGMELLASGKLIAPMPIKDELGKDLIDAARLQAMRDAMARDKTQGASATRLTDTMDETPSQKLFGVRDRPDAIMGEKGKLDYRTLDSFVEFKPPGAEFDLGFDGGSGDFFKPGVGARALLGQLGKYARHCFAFAHRTHLFSVYIRGTKARFIRWDRAGAIMTAEFDITTEIHLVVFYRLARATDAEKGWDSTIKDVTAEVDTNKLYKSAKKTVEEWLEHSRDVDEALQSRDMKRAGDNGVRWIVAQVPNSKGGSMEVLCRDLYSGAGDVFGRGTLTFPGATLPSDITSDGQPSSPHQIVLVKDTWRPEHAPKEWEIIEELNKKGVQNIPTLVTGGEIKTDDRYRATFTQDYALKPWAQRNKSLKLEKKIHQRLAEREVGIPLCKFREPRDVFIAVRDVVEGHKQACELAGYLHRDVSEGNILLYRRQGVSGVKGKAKAASEELWGGLLIDWEYARKFSQVLARQKERTGTYAFMSRRLLRSPKGYMQDITDDLESFFWVVLYICLRYLLTNLPRSTLAAFLKDCYRRDWKVHYHEEQGKVTGGNTRVAFVANQARVSDYRVRWVHQPAVDAWVDTVVEALTQLTLAQNKKEDDKVAAARAAAPKEEEEDDDDKDDDDDDKEDDDDDKEDDDDDKEDDDKDDDDEEDDDEEEDDEKEEEDLDNEDRDRDRDNTTGAPVSVPQDQVDTTDTPPLDDGEDVPAWKLDLPDCSMATHDWFLKTLEKALSSKKLWNVRVKKHDGRRTEDSEDRWADSKPKHGSNKMVTSRERTGDLRSATPHSTSLPGSSLGTRSRQTSSLVEDDGFYQDGGDEERDAPASKTRKIDGGRAQRSDGREEEEESVPSRSGSEGARSSSQ